MKKFMLLTLSVAALVLLSWQPAAEAQVSETNQAIQALTDFPGVGGRTMVEDFTKRGGADVGMIKKAAALLQDALSKAGGNAQARAQLEMAVAYANATMHKEARLSAQGALYYLCQGGGGEGCDKAPKFGSYVAP
ncbi:MAG: hypothetical protein E6K63_04205 [Nitrospirae bacterium]|nr:MAG: hypothetical protein E6K63_04205 [Nitrospirota bacterium]